MLDILHMITQTICNGVDGLTLAKPQFMDLCFQRTTAVDVNLMKAEQFLNQITRCIKINSACDRTL